MDLNQSALRKQAFGKIVRMVVLVLLAAVFIVPIVYTVVISLKTQTEIFTNPLSLPRSLQWRNYAMAWEIMDYPRTAFNTIMISLLSASGGLIMVILSSFAISRMRFGKGRLQNGTYSYFIAGIIVPTFVLLFPIYMMEAKLKILNTWWGVVLPYWGWTAPMHTLILVAAFRSIPETLDEAAIIDGCSTIGILFRIHLPILKPAIVTCFIVAILGVFNEFPLSSVILTSPGIQTLALTASRFKGMFSVNYALMSAGVVLIAIPEIIFFSFFQKNIVSGMIVGSVKG